MIRFLLKLIVFILLSSVPFFYYMLPSAKKKPFYWKTTYSASSLIIGASRAHMGLDPAVIEEELGLDHAMLNFAFSGATSPYGEPYLKLIKRKLAPRKTNDAIFILSVNPGVVSSYQREKYPVEEDFRVYDMWNININPNLEFIARNPNGDQPILSLLNSYLKRKFNQNKLLRPYLKLPRARKNDNIDRSSSRKKRKRQSKQERKPVFRPQKKIFFPNGFQGKFFSDEDLRKIDSINFIPANFLYNRMTPSKDRVQSLEETIAFLKEKGSVFLVRTPENEKIVERSEDYMPDFTIEMEKLANQSKVYFLDYSNLSKEKGYNLHDNVLHLEARSARAFSRDLSKDIKRLLAEQSK